MDYTILPNKPNSKDGILTRIRNLECAYKVLLQRVNKFSIRHCPTCKKERQFVELENTIEADHGYSICSVSVILGSSTPTRYKCLVCNGIFRRVKKEELVLDN